MKNSIKVLSIALLFSISLLRADNVVAKTEVAEKVASISEHEMKESLQARFLEIFEKRLGINPEEIGIYLEGYLDGYLKETSMKTKSSVEAKKLIKGLTWEGFLKYADSKKKKK
jgi:hypothetical protein